MDTKQVFKFFLEKGLLVDKDILGILSEEGDFDSVKLIIEKIQTHTHKKVITRELFYKNQEQMNRAFFSLPKEHQQKLEQLKIKLGLHIEISQERGSEEPTPSVLSDGGVVKVDVMDVLPGRKFGVQDFVSYFRDRFSAMRSLVQTNPSLVNLVSLNTLSTQSQSVSIIGMVLSKAVTKNNNIIFEVEDLTGTAKVLVNKDRAELIEKAQDVALDSVVGFKCSGNKEILFVNDIIFPETHLPERKYAPHEEYAVFIGDVHYGSKNFMEDNFLKFIDYVNGGFPNTPEAKKIRYLFICGDLITGIGNYPNQERDLVIDDLEAQYCGIAALLGKIRKDVKIIISPGNHEGVRLMEPQPLYDEKYAWALHEMDNVFLVENPARVTIGAVPGFDGFRVLMYHGFSYFYYADNVAQLMKIKAKNAPENIMEYLLKHRHLAPTHGSVQYFPFGNDVHLIREVPDIFISGHTHKGAITYYNNVLVVSCATWESMTPYQEKFGNEPDYCKVPLFNLKTRAVKILDFE